MNIFTLANMDQVSGRIRFCKLIIDGSCQFDEFCAEIKRDGNLKGQLIGLYLNMNHVADLKRLPRQMFRDITPAKETVKEFEIKKGDLRVYLIKEDGHIVIISGKKSTQQEDIKRFRSIKKRYLDSKKIKLWLHEKKY
jgi:putative component of toxin-antitoxin plasmid stabilization module